MAKTYSKNTRQGKVTEEAKASEQSKTEADEWSLEGWLNVSKSGKMIKVSVQEGDQSRLIGLVSVRQAERLLSGDIKGVPIKLPPEEQETE